MSQQRSNSQTRPLSRARSRSPVSRPTTPLRSSSRSSFRNSQTNGIDGLTALDSLNDQFTELSDSVADLEANFMHLQLMHESLGRFGESFASFLYGLNMNAFVVDFPEVCRISVVENISGSRFSIGTPQRFYQTMAAATAPERRPRHIHSACRCERWHQSWRR